MQEELLTGIVEQLAEKARNGVHILFMKVKFHVGVEGNEKADGLAQDACKPEKCPDVEHTGVEI